MFPRATRFRAEELFRCPSRRAWDRVIERHARTRFSWQAFSSIHAPPFLLRLETAIDWAATANPSAIRSIWPANVALDGWTDRLLPSNTKKLTSRFYSNPINSVLWPRSICTAVWKYALFEIRNTNFSLAARFRVDVRDENVGGGRGEGGFVERDRLE